jgi:tetratricopeptide (TPR) repeat protein
MPRPRRYGQKGLRLGLVALLFACAQAFAMTAMDEGVRAYRDGRYEEALAAFERAAREEPERAAVRFNLGLAHYKLGHYPEARREFLRVRKDTSMRAVAEYHLGLVAGRLGQTRRAEAHLRAAASSDSRQLRELAANALRRLGGKPDARSPAAWAMLGAGHDSNRNRIDEDIAIEGQDRESAYVDAWGTLLYPLPVSPELDLRAVAFRRDYETDDTLDQSSVQLSLRQSWRPAGWRLTMAAETEAILLRDDSLVKAAGVGLEAQRRLGPTTLRLRYQPAKVQADSAFDYLDGWRHRGGVTLDFNIGEQQWRLGYEIEESSQGYEAGDDIVYGQAPLRQGPVLRWSHALSPSIELDLSAAWRRSRYEQYDDVFPAPRRNDDLLQGGASLSWQIDRAWGLVLDYRYARNYSSDDTYDHRRQMLLLGVEWRY